MKKDLSICEEPQMKQWILMIRRSNNINSNSNSNSINTKTGGLRCLSQLREVVGFGIISVDIVGTVQNKGSRVPLKL